MIKLTESRDAVSVQRSGRRNLVCGQVFCSLVLIAACLAVRAQTHSLIGKPAPLFSRQTLDGQTIDLGRMRGKVVLLNFWATWCAPCLAEMPVFSQWQSEFHSQGLEVVGISMDDDADDAQNLKTKLGVSYPIAMGDAALGKEYGKVLGLPMTFLIGRDGKVIALYRGETDLKAMEARVRKALRPH